MSRKAFAMCPSKWVKVRKAPPDEIAIEGPPGPKLSPKEESERLVEDAPGPGLHHLTWQQHKGAGTAALLVLFALAILSNQAQRKLGRRKDNRVQATYDELMAMANLSRAYVSKGLTLLEEMGAITRAREGNRGVYELVGIDKPGHWCELPQQHLLNGTARMRLLDICNQQIKRATSLHALKLYMVLLAFRNGRDNVARLGYPTIQLYTGLRREDIALAVNILSAAGLCKVARDDEVTLVKGQRNHNRYIMLGLAAS